MAERIFGHVPGYFEGDVFETRYQLSQSGIHKPTQAGISGSGKEGADSIVLSGGYEDDQDYGNTIIYTGHGGNDPDTGKQSGHQKLERGNLALALNKLNGHPVRVVRGANQPSGFSPNSGYRYDGLYQVDDYWQQIGKSGYVIWRFRLNKIMEENKPVLPPLKESLVPYEAVKEVAPETPTHIIRTIRDTQQSFKLKELYDFTCQICSIRLEGAAGPYAEAVHIRPLGAPHNGPDTIDNILCLCPNHHILFDFGTISIADDLSIIGQAGRLWTHPKHIISKVHLKYHREHYLTVSK